VAGRRRSGREIRRWGSGLRASTGGEQCGKGRKEVRVWQFLQFIYEDGDLRAVNEPDWNFRAGPGDLPCWGGGPGPGTVYGPCQSGHGDKRAVPCLGRVKISCFQASRGAADHLAICTHKMFGSQCYDLAIDKIRKVKNQNFIIIFLKS
jgi:hypothetical protein